MQQSISTNKQIIYVCSTCNLRIGKEVGQVEFRIKKIKHTNGLIPFHTIHLCKNNYVVQMIHVDNNFDVRSQVVISINPKIEKNNSHLIPLTPKKKNNEMRIIHSTINEISNNPSEHLSFSLTDYDKNYTMVLSDYEGGPARSSSYYRVGGGGARRSRRSSSLSGKSRPSTRSQYY